MIGPIYDSVLAGLDGVQYAALLWKWESYALNLVCCICPLNELKHRLKTETSPDRLVIVKNVASVRL
jgi:hypothetical protein